MRKLILGFVVLAAAIVAPAISVAQAPPPVPALPDTERRTQYAISAQTGPFDVGFAVYGDGTDYGNWIQVQLDGVALAPVTDWTLALVAGTLASSARPLTNARVTLTTARTGSLEIIGARRPRRIAQFNENQGVSARALNLAFTDIVAQNRETWDKILRSGGGGGGLVASPMFVGTSLYPNITAPITTAATSTNGSPTIVVTSATGLAVGMVVEGTAFLPGCSTVEAAFRSPYVTTIVGTTVTMSCPASATQSGGAITFGHARYDATSAILANSGGFQSLLVGAASQGNTAAWLPQVGTGQSYLGAAALQVVVTPGGLWGGVFAGRTSDANTNTTFPLTCFFLADAPGPGGIGGSCQYTQSNLYAATAGITGHIQHEYSLNSNWPTADLDPYSSAGATNGTRNIRYDCGTGQSATFPNNCSAIADIVFNGARYRSGFVVATNAMDTTAGRIAPFVALPPNVGISWYVAANRSAANLYSAQTVLAGAQDIIITDTGIDFKYGGILRMTLSTQAGTLLLNGSSSGIVTIGASAGTFNFNLPTAAGAVGQCLVSGGGGAAPMTWGGCTGTGGVGTVTNIATTAPITGGPITATGTIACATCTTSAAALTANQLVLGAGLQAAQALGSLGTATTVLHGNAGGVPSFGAVALGTDVSGTLAVANGGTGLTSGTSGGVLAFTGAGTIASSGVLTAGLPVIGGGAGVAPTVGTRSGNTTQFVTTTGAQTSGNCVSIDASGNHVSVGAPCGSGGGGITALTGDVTASGTGSVTATLATVNGNVGSFGSATQSPQITVNGKGLITAAANVTITPTVGSITGLGTGVSTALGVNIGTAGALVVNGGALGTPSSGTLTNATGLPIGTGVSGLGTGTAAALGTNVGTAGAVVVNGGALGTPSSGTLTNATGLPISTGVSGLGTGVATALAGTQWTQVSAAPTGSTGGVMTCASCAYRYQQVGKTVTVAYAIAGPTVGTATGPTTFLALPVAAKASAYEACASANAAGGAPQPYVMIAGGGGTNLQIWLNQPATSLAGQFIGVSCTYEAL